MSLSGVILCGLVLIIVMLVGLSLWYLCGAALRALVNYHLDRMVEILFTKPYEVNLWEGVNALRRFGIQRTMENEFRAHSGTVLLKPVGTHRQFPHFDGLLFSPAQLYRQALDESVSVDLTTVLGRRCARPLRLSMPVMVAGMGYGVALSESFSIALAKGTAKVGTAFNTGQGPVLEEHRRYAHKMIVQYDGAPWRPSDDILRMADMVEIRYGQGANAGATTIIKADDLPPDVLRDMHVPMGRQGGELRIPAGIPGVQGARDLKRLVRRLRGVSRGAPIALKLAAGHDLERDMEIAIRAGVDVIVIDGAQGGTHGAPAILVDDFGLPTLSALCRAADFLREHRLHGKVDLVVSGGIRTPGDVLKALALGASAVYIGTAALFATMHVQITRTIPFTAPTGLAWSVGGIRRKFREDEGAASLARFLTSCGEELRAGLRALGKRSVSELSRTDLVAWDPAVARIARVPLI